MTLKVMSYNIRHGADANLDMAILAEDIKRNRADVVGIQEIDEGTARVGGLRTLEELSRATGYPYFAFSKAMDYKGGAYGIGILSRYPIVESETVPLFYETEPRVLCHGRLDVEGQRVDFFNTHLDYISKDARAKEFGQLQELLSSYDCFVLTGDFNTADMTEFEAITVATPVNHGQLGSFVSSGKAIDNILYTPNFTLTDSGMDPVTHSDHYLIWAELALCS